MRQTGNGPLAGHPCLRYHFREHGPRGVGQPTPSHSRLRSPAADTGLCRLRTARTRLVALVRTARIKRTGSTTACGHIAGRRGILLDRQTDPRALRRRLRSTRKWDYTVPCPKETRCGSGIPGVRRLVGCRTRKLCDRADPSFVGPLQLRSVGAAALGGVGRRGSTGAVGQFPQTTTSPSPL